MEEREKIARLQEMVDQSHSIVFFGGAGGQYRERYPGFSQHRCDCTISNMLILRKLF